MKLSCQEGLVNGNTFAEKLRNLEKYGFDGVELGGHFLNHSAKLEERVKALRDSKIKASSICGGFSCEFVHPNPARRKACINIVKRLLDFGGQVGAAGPMSVPIFNGNERVPDLSPWKTRHQIEIEFFTEIVRDIAAHAVQAKATLLLEPLNRYESNSLGNIAEAAALCRKIGPGVKVLADFFHMHIEETNTPKALLESGDMVGHVHLADNTRKEPGSGDIDFKAGFSALKKVKFTGYMALECGLTDKPEVALPRSVAFLKRCIAEA